MGEGGGLKLKGGGGQMLLKLCGHHKWMVPNGKQLTKSPFIND